MALDPTSASNAQQHQVTHMHMSWLVDFDDKKIYASCKYDVQVHNPAAKQFTLDVRALEVLSVDIDGASAPFEVQAFTDFGQKLSIQLPEMPRGPTMSVQIQYTAVGGPALAWLLPAQTKDGRLPFLFTQGQAALNRSLLPCQDTPSTRTSYSSCVVVRRQFTALMSARMQGMCIAYPAAHPPSASSHALSGTVHGDACFMSNPYCPGHTGKAVGCSVEPSLLSLLPLPPNHPALGVDSEASWHAFSFLQPRPIPIYLLALVVGNLACAEIGPRSRVWAEPSLLPAAAWEYGNGDITERYVSTAERLFGPYDWGRYDCCVLPPSFPYGGMENTNLTTLNPMTIAGDQSLSDVLCHEIIHSWFGDNVTNRDWSCFWLNEGLTMYGQRRVTQEVHGRAFTALETTTGRELLRGLIRDIGPEDPLTRLCVPLGHGVDPDDTYTEMPYEGGYAFVCYLRQLAVGHIEDVQAADASFDAFLAAYVSKFKFTCVSPQDFLAHYLTYFHAQLGSAWSGLPGGIDEAGIRALVADETLTEAGKVYWACGAPVPAAGDKGAVQAMSQLPWPTGKALGAAAACACGGVHALPGYEFARWLHQPGWPPYYPDLSLAEGLTQPAEALVELAWQGKEQEFKDAAGQAWAAWPTYQKLHALDTIQGRIEGEQRSSTACSSEWREGGQAGAHFTKVHALLGLLDSTLGLSAATNAEIRLRWSTLVARGQWSPAYPSLLSFARMTGKQKYTLPLYRALLDAAPLPDGSTPGRQQALDMFTATAPSLHVAVRDKVRGLLAQAGLQAQ